MDGVFFDRQGHQKSGSGQEVHSIHYLRQGAQVACSRLAAYPAMVPSRGGAARRLTRLRRQPARHGVDGAELHRRHPARKGQVPRIALLARRWRIGTNFGWTTSDAPDVPVAPPPCGGTDTKSCHVSPILG